MIYSSVGKGLPCNLDDQRVISKNMSKSKNMTQLHNAILQLPHVTLGTLNLVFIGGFKWLLGYLTCPQVRCKFSCLLMP